MPVYRYKSLGVEISDIQAAVPGSLTLGATGTSIYVDITALSGSKPDLDEVMASYGYAFNATDPVTTPQEAASADLSLSYATPGNVGTANAQGVASTVSRSDHTHALSEATLRAVSAVLGASFSVNGQKITNLGTPTASTDAATKAYVDAVAAGLQPKAAVRVATTGNITLSGNQTLDTSVLTVNGDRVLVKDQSTGTQNGIYLANSGAWTRAADLPIGASAKNVYMFISEGASQADQLWICTNDAPNDVVGTDALVFAFYQTGGGGGVPTSRLLTAGAGLTGGGTLAADRTFNVAANADGSITVNADDIQVGVLATDAQHGLRGGGTQHAVVVAAGAAGFMTGTDKTKLDGVATGATNTALTASAPENVTKATAGVGVATTAARADHKHDVTTGTPVAIDGANAEGTSANLARADHVHNHGAQTDGSFHAVAIPSGANGFLSGVDKAKLDGIASGATNTALASTAPADTTKAAAFVGVGTTAARADHKHDIATAVPVAIAAANSEGVSSSIARADHVHAHGTQTDGTMHAAATGSVAGFMSTTDKSKLDGVASGATATPLTASAPLDVTKTSAVAGFSSFAARADHKHDISTGPAVANPPGTSSVEGVASSMARSDHTHAIPAYGSAALTICQGNDARLSDDRTASGLRSTTTVVNVSSAVAPTVGQVLTATGGSAATWQTPSASSGGLRQTVFAPISSDTTTTSSTFVDLITQAITITSGGILLINVSASVSNSSVNKAATFRITIDGVTKGGFGVELKSADVPCSGAYVARVTGLAVGARTVKVQWKTTTGTMQIRPITHPDDEHCSLLIQEVSV